MPIQKVLVVQQVKLPAFARSMVFEKFFLWLALCSGRTSIICVKEGTVQIRTKPWTMMRCTSIVQLQLEVGKDAMNRQHRIRFVE